MAGGDITRFTNLSQETGAHAGVGVRFDATEIMQGVTEVICYGTAVVVKPAR